MARPHLSLYRRTLVALAMLLGGCSADQPEVWNPLTVAWQRQNCPPGKDLRPFMVGGGRVIEATLMQLGATRLYMPTAWHRWSPRVPWASPAPAGVVVLTGGSGHFVDEQGEIVSEPLAFPNSGYQESCLGYVHRRVKGERRDIDPDFALSLRFRFAFIDSPKGLVTDHGPTVSGYPALRFVYNEGGSPDRVYDGAPAMVFPLRPGVPVTQIIDGRPMTFRSTPGGSFVTWRITDEIIGSFEVTGGVPPAHVAALARQALSIWHWLQTPPALRDNGGRMAF